MSTEGRRVLALWLPSFPLQRLLQARGVQGPLAVGGDGRVLYGDRLARMAGVAAGQSKSQAQAQCAGLQWVPLQPEKDRSALRALAEALLLRAPAVEPVDPDALLLDASAAHLEGGEAAWLERVLSTVSELGYYGKVAVADGRRPALAVARHGRERRAVVPPGETSRALAPLPVEALGLSEAVCAHLRALGVETVGALTQLPRQALTHRFGAAGEAASGWARGQDASLLSPYLPQALPEAAFEFDGAISHWEPLLFALKRLADAVAARLQGRGLGAVRLDVALTLESGDETHLLLPLARPTAATAAWMAPLKERVADLRLSDAVTAVRLSVSVAAKAAREQLSLEDSPTQLAALESVMARLLARLGEDAVTGVALVDRHRPEAAYRRQAFAPEGRAASRVSADVLPEEVAVRPTRLLFKPEPVDPLERGGRWVGLRLEGQVYRVLHQAGPERLEGEWWSGPFGRDYYRVELDSLGPCWVFLDHADHRVYLHGFFD